MLCIVLEKNGKIPGMIVDFVFFFLFFISSTSVLLKSQIWLVKSGWYKLPLVALFHLHSFEVMEIGFLSRKSTQISESRHYF